MRFWSWLRCGEGGGHIPETWFQSSVVTHHRGGPGKSGFFSQDISLSLKGGQTRRALETLVTLLPCHPFSSKEKGFFSALDQDRGEISKFPETADSGAEEALVGIG